MSGKLILQWGEFDLEPTEGYVEGPTRDDVRSIVLHLGLCENGYVVLGQSESKFIQTGVADPEEPEAGLVVQYRDGGSDKHFQLDDEFVDAARAVEMLLAYFDDPKSITEKGEWVRVEG